MHQNHPAIQYFLKYKQVIYNDHVAIAFDGEQFYMSNGSGIVADKLNAILKACPAFLNYVRKVFTARPVIKPVDQVMNELKRLVDELNLFGDYNYVHVIHNYITESRDYMSSDIDIVCLWYRFNKAPLVFKAIINIARAIAHADLFVATIVINNKDTEIVFIDNRGACVTVSIANIDKINIGDLIADIRGCGMLELNYAQLNLLASTLGYYTEPLGNRVYRSHLASDLRAAIEPRDMCIKPAPWSIGDASSYTACRHGITVASDDDEDKCMKAMFATNATFLTATDIVKKHIESMKERLESVL